MSKPLAELRDPQLKASTGGMAHMAIGFLAIAAAVVVITVAALSVRDQDQKIARMKREHDKLEATVQRLGRALVDGHDYSIALAEAIATVAVRNEQINRAEHAEHRTSKVLPPRSK